MAVKRLFSPIKLSSALPNRCRSACCQTQSPLRRYISPGGEEQAVFRNGTVITLFRDGRKETEFSNGQKETLCVSRQSQTTKNFTSNLELQPHVTSLLVVNLDTRTDTLMAQRSARTLMVLCVFCASTAARALPIRTALTESKVHAAWLPAPHNAHARCRCKWSHRRAIG
jgi:hypothetical protein